MKKIYLSILLTLGIGAAKAQLRLIDPATGNDALPTYTVYLGAGSPTHSFDFELHNDYSTSKTIKSKRYLNSYTAGHDVYFCFGTNCYSAFTTPVHAPNQSVNLAGGAMLPNGAGTYGLKTDFDDNMVLGSTQVRYTLYDVNNTADSVSLIINYEVTAVGLAKLDAKNFILSNSVPNPATNTTSVKYNFASQPNKASLKLFNMVGVMVKEIELEGLDGKAQIDVSNLSDGLYFYSLVVNDKIISTKKLVVGK